jgi:hypothetical protein
MPLLLDSSSVVMVLKCLVFFQGCLLSKYSSVLVVFDAVEWL